MEEHEEEMSMEDEVSDGKVIAYFYPVEGGSRLSLEVECTGEQVINLILALMEQARLSMGKLALYQELQKLSKAMSRDN